jgi:hypothetical protein
VALAWTAVGGVAAWQAAAAPLRAAAHAAMAGLTSALVPVLALPGHDAWRVALVAAHAALYATVVPPLRPRLALLPALVALAGASAGALALLRSRPAFDYPPFLTPASAAAAVVVAGWAVLAWQARRGRAPGTAELPRDARSALVAAAGLALLVWGREELARAGSPDVATFLLVGYFATTGLVAIRVGQRRRIGPLRQVGLALALYAALKALLQVSALARVELRVGSYLLVGGFLLAVGYWYRTAGDREPR